MVVDDNVKSSYQSCNKRNLNSAYNEKLGLDIRVFQTLFPKTTYLAEGWVKIYNVMVKTEMARRTAKLCLNQKTFQTDLKTDAWQVPPNCLRKKCFFKTPYWTFFLENLQSFLVCSEPSPPVTSCPKLLQNLHRLFAFPRTAVPFQKLYVGTLVLALFYQIQI